MTSCISSHEQQLRQQLFIAAKNILITETNLFRRRSTTFNGNKMFINLKWFTNYILSVFYPKVP